MKPPWPWITRLDPDLRDDLADLLAFHFAEGAGDALGAFKQEQLLAVMRRPGARGRIAAANQVEGLVHMGRPMDLGLGLADNAFIAGGGFILRNRRSPARRRPCRQPRSGRRRPSGRSCRNRACPAYPRARSAPPGQDHRTFVQTVIRAENAEAGFRTAKDDRPAH